MRYRLEIQFDTEDDPECDAFATMLLSAYVQVQDSEDIETSNVTMRLSKRTVGIAWELVEHIS